jgi:hypothetical protein
MTPSGRNRAPLSRCGKVSLGRTRITAWPLALLASFAWASVVAQSPDLPSWNDGPAKTRIIEFVRTVTDRNGKDYVAPEARIATFDNDGTLWSEQPIYNQFAFVLDRVKAMAPQHPDWSDTQPYKAVLDGDT